MTTMGAIFREKGIKPQQFRRGKPTKPKQTTPPAQEPERQPAARETVKFAAGTEFVLSFGCPRKLVPEGIQVLPASGGGATGAAPEDTGARRFSKVQIDLEGLMTRCIVDGINVRERSGFCRVYVNCTTGVGEKQGFHHWHGAYEKFVRKEIGRVWKRAVVKSADGRTTLELRDARRDEAAVKIRFGIEG